MLFPYILTVIYSDNLQKDIAANNGKENWLANPYIS